MKQQSTVICLVGYQQQQYGVVTCDPGKTLTAYGNANKLRALISMLRESYPRLKDYDLVQQLPSILNGYTYWASPAQLSDIDTNLLKKPVTIPPAKK